MSNREAIAAYLFVCNSTVSGAVSRFSLATTKWPSDARPRMSSRSPLSTAARLPPVELGRHDKDVVTEDLRMRQHPLLQVLTLTQPGLSQRDRGRSPCRVPKYRKDQLVGRAPTVGAGAAPQIHASRTGRTLRLTGTLRRPTPTRRNHAIHPLWCDSATTADRLIGTWLRSVPGRSGCSSASAYDRRRMSAVDLWVAVS